MITYNLDNIRYISKLISDSYGETKYGYMARNRPEILLEYYRPEDVFSLESITFNGYNDRMVASGGGIVYYKDFDDTKTVVLIKSSSWQDLISKLKRSK